MLNQFSALKTEEEITHHAFTGVINLFLVSNIFLYSVFRC